MKNAKLSKLIKDYGYTQLARDANMSATMVFSVANGGRQFSPKRVSVIAALLGCERRIVRPDIY